MKRCLLVIVTVVFMATFASMAGAWEVRIKNSCNKNVTIKVTGEHLFWKQKDCETTVAANTTGTCQLPGAICPFDILGEYNVRGSWYDLNQIHCMTADANICCCWNVNVEVVQRGMDSCRLELR